MRKGNRFGARQAEKANLNIQAYMDVREVAAVATFMARRGLLSAAQYGPIVHYAFDFLLQAIREDCPTEIVEYEMVADALHALEGMGFSMGQFQGYSRKKIVDSLQQEALYKDHGVQIPLPPAAQQKARSRIEEYDNTPVWLKQLRQDPTYQACTNPDIKGAIEAAAKYAWEQENFIPTAAPPPDLKYDEAGVMILPENKPDRARLVQNAVDYILQLESGGLKRNEHVEAVLAPYMDEARLILQDRERLEYEREQRIKEQEALRKGPSLTV